jgi:cytochrome c556
MKKIKTAQGKLRANLRNKKGAEAAEAGEELARLAADILRYDGDVKDGDNKGQKVRDQKDFKQWAEDLKKAGETVAKHAKAGKWDDADKEKDNIGRTCSNCHDVYDK